MDPEGQETRPAPAGDGAPPGARDPAPGSRPEAEGTGDVLYATIIVKPFRVEPVLLALEPFRARSIAITEVRGYGRQKGHLELYKGSEYAISFIPKVKIEVAIPAGEVEGLLPAVARAARTGRIGDGKVFVQGCELIDLDAE